MMTVETLEKLLADLPVEANSLLIYVSDENEGTTKPMECELSLEYSDSGPFIKLYV